jgi:WD40 repeat protein
MRAELRVSGGGVCCLCEVAPSLLAVGSDNELYLGLVNVHSMEVVAELNGHTAAVVGLLSLDDGSTFVSASYDRSVCIWNTESSVPA